MDTLVTYDLSDGVATITLDDGKVNAISLPMVAAINEALDRAEADGAVVVLAGRPGRFSAGFDLKTLSAGGDDADALVRGGFGLAARLLAFPAPVVGACTGHAIALGLTLLCCCDYRIGAAGDYKLVMNEVGIGIAIPELAITLLRARLHPSILHRATVLAEVFSPEHAVADGWFDRVVGADDLLDAAREHARSLTSLNRAALHTTKLRAAKATLDSIAAYLASDDVRLGTPS